MVGDCAASVMQYTFSILNEASILFPQLCTLVKGPLLFQVVSLAFLM
jgi:hypothetical protein